MSQNRNNMLLLHFPPDLGFFNSAVHLKIHVSLADSLNDLFNGTFWGEKLRTRVVELFFLLSLFVKIILNN